MAVNRNSWEMKQLMWKTSNRVPELKVLWVRMAEHGTLVGDGR